MFLLTHTLRSNTEEAFDDVGSSRYGEASAVTLFLGEVLTLNRPCLTIAFRKSEAIVHALNEPLLFGAERCTIIDEPSSLGGLVLFY